MLLVAAVLCSAPLGAQLKLINKSPGSQREPRSLARPCGWGDGGAGEVGEGWAGEMSHSSVLLTLLWGSSVRGCGQEACSINNRK